MLMSLGVKIYCTLDIIKYGSSVHVSKGTDSYLFVDFMACVFK